MAYAAAASTAFLIMNDPARTTQEPPPSPPSPSMTSTDPVWTELASKYDSKISMDETIIGVGILRRLLCRHAHGSVLEVSTGTGRNIPYLASRASSLTLTDRNENMLHVALEKVATLPEGQQSIVHSEVASVDRLPFLANTFDTVVDTFGLCR